MVENTAFIKPSKRVRFKKLLKRIFGRSKGSIVFNLLNYAFFILFGIIMLYPFLHVVITSLETNILVDGVVKKVYNFSSYGVVLGNKNIVNAFLLTVFVVIVHTVLHILLTLMAAYPLSKKDLRGRTGILLFIVFTMLFSGGMIPNYILITQTLKWQNSIMVYIVPGLMSGFNIIITKNFLQGIPESLEEAAIIDGANDFVIMLKIFFPLSLPIMATVGLWAGVGKWNNWMTGVLYISKPNLMVIQNILRDMMIAASSTESGQGGNIYLSMADNIKMATVVVGTLPIVIVYPFVQKYFVKGMLLGSVKG